MGNSVKCRINCVLCDCELENLTPDGNQPVKGTAFQSYGHYGSGMFDPMDGTYLEINICDYCLSLIGTRGNVLMGFPVPPPPRGPLVKWEVQTRLPKERGNVLNFPTTDNVVNFPLEEEDASTPDK